MATDAKSRALEIVQERRDAGNAIPDHDEHWIEDPRRKKFDYTTFRMIHCSECKRAHNNDGCQGDNNEIDNCLDASAPFDDVGYMYGA